MIKGGQCHLLHARLFMPIYAIIFSPTVHLSCFSRPGCVINRGGIYVFFRIFVTNVNPTFRNLAIAIALNPCTSKTPVANVNLKNKKQPCRTNRLQSGRHIFENKSGIPLTPYWERMIDGSESPNARGSFCSRVAYQ